MHLKMNKVVVPVNRIGMDQNVKSILKTTVTQSALDVMDLQQINAPNV